MTWAVYALCVFSASMASFELPPERIIVVFVAVVVSRLTGWLAGRRSR